VRGAFLLGSAAVHALLCQLFYVDFVCGLPNSVDALLGTVGVPGREGGPLGFLSWGGCMGFPRRPLSDDLSLCIVSIRRLLSCHPLVKGGEMNARFTFSGLVLVALATGAAATSVDDDAWKPYEFLIGEWVGEGGGQPGQGSGRFSFARELQGKVLVRRNRAEFPAAQGRPALTHEDLMVTYQPDASGSSKAIYFDSEGHVINYAATLSDQGRTLTFVSDAAAGAPRFRLSYTKIGDDRVTIKFEIAPPGKPDEFKTYLEGGAHRQAESAPGKAKS
jgi:hypothetical protein